MGKKKITQEEIEEMVRLYNTTDHTAKSLGILFKVSNSTALQYIKDNGGIMKEFSDLLRKYPVNHNFFENIENRQTSYVFGLWHSDGYNNEKSKRCVLSLQEKDKELLEKVNLLIHPNKPLTKKAVNKTIPGRENWKDQWAIFISSKQISEDLAKLGCCQNKTFNTPWPKFLEHNEEAMKGYLLGMLDGDGHISKRQSVNIMAPLDWCEEFKDYIKKTLNLDVNIRLSPKGEKNNIRYGEISKTPNVLTFLNWLYDGADLFLKRKHEQYLYILNYRDPFPNLIHEDGRPYTQKEKNKRWRMLSKLKKQRESEKDIIL